MVTPAGILSFMLDFATTAIVSILFLVDPPGTVPAFIALTSKFSPEKRKRVAFVASLTATLTLMGFAAVGSVLFKHLGLTLPAFQIAGGLILFVVALDMIRNQDTDEKEREAVEDTAPTPLQDGETRPIAAVKYDDRDPGSVGITPLAIPFLAGPAALSTVTVMVSKAANTVEMGIVFIAIGLTGVTCYLTLRLASPIQKRLGTNGIHVLHRILGLVLAGIAVQFVLDGLNKAGLIPPVKGP
jgi:multiple antibiotic resistance protein